MQKNLNGSSEGDFTLNNRVMPEIKATNQDFLSDVLLNTETGYNLFVGEPRWDMAYDREVETKEDFKERVAIRPSLFQTPGIVRDQEENMYSDADPVGHLRLVSMIANDYSNVCRFNDLNMIKVLNAVEMQSMPKILSLAGLFHDYHEGNPEIGDRVQKDKSFKLQELLSMYTSTLEEIKNEYRHSLDETESPLREKREAGMNRIFDEVFIVLASDPKLEEKYNISLQDKIEYFENSGLSQQKTEEAIKLLSESQKYKYIEMAKMLENLHQVSFLMAALSMEEISPQDYKTKALKLEATAKTLVALLKSLEENDDIYVARFITKNMEEINNNLSLSEDPKVQLELLKAGRNIINPKGLFGDV